MTQEPTLASAPQATTLRTIVTTWDERERFRWKLAQIARDNPHLIADIGLTKRQVEVEITKPFWRV